MVSSFGLKLKLHLESHTIMKTHFLLALNCLVFFAMPLCVFAAPPTDAPAGFFFPAKLCATGELVSDADAQEGIAATSEGEYHPLVEVKLPKTGADFTIWDSNVPRKSSSTWPPDRAKARYRNQLVWIPRARRSKSSRSNSLCVAKVFIPSVNQ